MNEIDRIRREYARRAGDARYDELYSCHNKGHLFAIQVRERTILDVLSRHGLRSLESKRILDVGCGQGDELSRLISYGASPNNVFGLDLMTESIVQGRRQLPNLKLACGNAERLPFPDGSFDLCTQFTVFSSVLENSLRKGIASEMLRVLAPDGAILWYDYWLNPLNRQTRGVRPSEIRQLFPNCAFDFHKVTLAPPLARRIVRYSWLMCEALERIPWLRTHYVAMIRRGSSLC